MRHIRTKILAGTIGRILRPLIPTFLRNGIAYDRFEEIARRAYVDEAIAKAQRDYRHATISSVSAATGISRKKIKRIHKNELGDSTDPEQNYNLAFCVICAWLKDPRFAHAKAKPRVLSIDSAENSFSDLVNCYGGDTSTRDMLKLLKSLNCVEVNKGLVHLLSRAHQPGSDPEEFIRRLRRDTSEMINPINRKQKNIIDASRCFERKDRDSGLDQDRLAEYREYLLRHSQALLEDRD